MITTERSRRLPVRACDVTQVLREADAFGHLVQRFGGTHDVQVRRDRLACEVRHSVTLNSRPSTRLWWLVIGRPLYDELVEDAFDELARRTGSPVRRPARFAPYARSIRRLRTAQAPQRPTTIAAAELPEPLPLAS